MTARKINFLESLFKSLTRNPSYHRDIELALKVSLEETIWNNIRPVKII